MVRDKYALFVDTNEILETMFYFYLTDHNIDRSSKKEIRSALAVFVSQVEQYLIDDYELDDYELDAEEEDLD